mmetsp:Transcript_88352/g.140589  ORF Transcript_88352/g.140589 Transcript_88352/m.140589 type:complete len:294 (+) Transcript_88352:712-1593(+)
MSPGDLPQLRFAFRSRGVPWHCQISDQSTGDIVDDELHSLVTDTGRSILESFLPFRYAAQCRLVHRSLGVPRQHRRAVHGAEDELRQAAAVVVEGRLAAVVQLRKGCILREAELQPKCTEAVQLHQQRATQEGLHLPSCFSKSRDFQRPREALRNVGCPGNQGALGQGLRRKRRRLPRPQRNLKAAAKEVLSPGQVRRTAVAGVLFTMKHHTFRMLIIHEEQLLSSIEADGRRAAQLSFSPFHMMSFVVLLIPHAWNKNICGARLCIFPQKHGVHGPCGRHPLPGPIGHQRRP